MRDQNCILPNWLESGRVQNSFRLEILVILRCTWTNNIIRYNHSSLKIQSINELSESNQSIVCRIKTRIYGFQVQFWFLFVSAKAAFYMVLLWTSRFNINTSSGALNYICQVPHIFVSSRSVVVTNADMCPLKNAVACSWEPLNPVNLVSPVFIW